MLVGLSTMDFEALAACARLAGIDYAREGISEHDRLWARLLLWIAAQTGSPASASPEEIERTALEWLADLSGLDRPASQTSSQLQDALWDHISRRASRHLLPVWKVASSMATLGPPEGLDSELLLLRRVAARLLPSDPTRALLREEWDRFRPVVHASDLKEAIHPELAQIAEHPHLIRPTLVLTLVVALADSKIENEESRLYRAVASELKVPPTEATDIQVRVTQGFWAARGEVAPAQLSQDEEEDPAGASLFAAHRTLEKSGVLNALEGEVQSGFLAALHRRIVEDPDFQRGLRGWNQTPWLWPLGLASGLCLYLRHRLHPQVRHALSAIMYKAYLAERTRPGV